jgi:hypothetical protein
LIQPPQTALRNAQQSNILHREEENMSESWAPKGLTASDGVTAPLIGCVLQANNGLSDRPVAASGGHRS